MSWLAWLYFGAPIVVLLGVFLWTTGEGAREARGVTAGRRLIDAVLGELSAERVQTDGGRTSAWIDGVPLKLTICERHDQPRLELELPLRSCPVSLVVVRHGDRLDEDVPLPEPGWRTGDPAFDDALTLLGDREDVATAVTPQLREAAREVVGELGWKISNSTLRWEETAAEQEASDVAGRVPAALAMARAMAGDDEESAPGRRISDETAAPLAGLAAEQFFTRRPRGKKARRVARELADHPSGRVRLYAALALAPGGAQRLESIAGSDDGGERVLCDALAAASDLLPGELVAAAALEALEFPDEELRIAACSALAKEGHLDTVGALHRLAATRHVGRSVRDSANDAAAEIIARLGGDAVAGGLELAVEDPQEGGLSYPVNDPAEGALSRVTTEPGDGGLSYAREEPADES